jgi:hypothetical protein
MMMMEDSPVGCCVVTKKVFCRCFVCFVVVPFVRLFGVVFLRRRQDMDDGEEKAVL